MVLRAIQLLLLLTITVPAVAEDLWIYRLGSDGGQRFLPGELIEQTVSIRRGVNPLLGWSFGVAVDPSLGTLLSVDPAPLLLTASGGNPPDFIDVQLLPDGFTVETVICASPCAGWSPSPFSVPIFDFVVDPVADSGEHTICFSGTLGTPAVPIAVTNTVEAVMPIAHCGTICITEHFEWEFAVVDLMVPYDRLTGLAELTATLTIGQYPCEYFASSSPGFSFGVGHDPNFLQALDVIPAPPIQAVNGGDGPSFFSVGIYPDGVTVGCVASFLGADSFEFIGETETALVDYETVPAGLIGAPDPISTPLVWRDDLGAPPVSIIIMPGDSSIVPEGLIDGTVNLVPTDVPPYIRGDVNEDGAVDLADAIGLLAYLFQSGSAPGCDAEGDINTDATIDIGDPICVLVYLFTLGHPPHPPFPDCGSAGVADCPTASAACP